MTHRLAACLAIASLTFMAARPAAAATTHTFDTVDALEIEYNSNSGNIVIVTGILVGQMTPTTHTFAFNGYGDDARQCERFAVIAMSKPGKYRFAIGTMYNKGCKLILRTP
jgi:hypothetical protein